MISEIFKRDTVMMLLALFLSACSTIKDSHQPEFYFQQERALAESRGIPLVEVFLVETPLSEALKILNKKIKEHGSSMKIVFELNNGALFPLENISEETRDARLEIPINLEYTIIGVQDAVGVIVRQTKLDVVYWGNLIIFNPSSKYKP